MAVPPKRSDIAEPERQRQIRTWNGRTPAPGATLKLKTIKKCIDLEKIKARPPAGDPDEALAMNLPEFEDLIGFVVLDYYKFFARV